jgi:hypothetical protein
MDVADELVELHPDRQIYRFVRLLDCTERFASVTDPRRPEIELIQLKIGVCPDLVWA